MSGRRHECPGTLVFERFLLGELDGPELARIEEGLATCRDCARVVDELRADDAAFALRPVPATLRGLWTGESRVGRARWQRAALVAAPLAAAAVVLLVLARPDGGGLDDDADPGAVPAIGERGGPGTTRTMGGDDPGGGAISGSTELSLGFYVLDPKEGRPVLGRPGQALREGDRIQFWYDGAGGGPAVLVGIDGRREVTRYHPLGMDPEPLPPARGRLVDVAIQLDDARGAERFFLCVGPGVSPSVVEAAARAAASGGDDPAVIDRLPLDCDQATVWIVKE